MGNINQFDIYDFIFSELSYGSHTNTHRLTDTSSHRGSKHLLSLTPVLPGHNGIGHMNGFNDSVEEKDEMLDLNQVQAELMLDVNAQEMMLNEYPADCCPSSSISTSRVLRETMTHRSGRDGPT